MTESLKKILDSYNNDPGRLMDILIDLQMAEGYVSDEAVYDIAGALKISSARVKETISFYHFFSVEPTGKYAVYLDDSAVANMKGRAVVAEAFEKEAGCGFGSVSEDGNIGLFNTACIGMSDQSPAAIINGVVFTNLTSEKVSSIVSDMKKGVPAADMVKEYGDGNNANENVRAEVKNNIQKKGEVMFADYNPGVSLKKAVEMKPEEVISEVKTASLRGRGGAGFPTGMKWEFCRNTPSEKRFVICNADEGEPGTFKDRVVLTERAGLLFEGMAVAGYAIGASEGILYLRGEYIYLRNYLNEVLKKMRSENLLGKNVCGKEGFDFDIRIQMGAGAYVCGEESALIESAEGKRGEPRIRPPFPVQKGYQDKPTVVNNVESLCFASRIIENGAEWFKGFGTDQSAGTKLLSISGDCEKPGIYEVEWGISVKDILEMAGASETQAVQVGGPSGTCISESEFGRIIGFEDLSTGGSFIIMNKSRDILEVVENFMDFFIEESCGSCVPCRAGSTLIKQRLEKIRRGHGVPKDIEELKSWGAIMNTTCRCGLGQTASNPVTSTIEHFRSLYEDKVKKDMDYYSEFDLDEAVKESCEATGRTASN
ncbi:MAG: NAD(P)H-dependent oxidoreductase subunit E [Fibrobacterota bacterium]